MADADAVEAAAERIENELGPIEVWVNNDMTGVFSPIKEMTAAEFKRVTEATYLGFVNVTLAALKRMLPRDRARIIQVGERLVAYRRDSLTSHETRHNSIGLKADFLKKLNRSRLFSNQPWRPKPSYAHGAMIGVRSTSAFRP